jgi:hypothetical protein
MRETMVRLDPHELFFPEDGAEERSLTKRALRRPRKAPVQNLPRPRFHSRGFTPGEQAAIEAFPEWRYSYGCRERHPRYDSPDLGPRYDCGPNFLAPVEPAYEDEEVTTDEHHDARITSLWPDRPPKRIPSAPEGKPGTPVFRRLPGPPARTPGGEPEEIAMLAEERWIEVTGGLNFAGKYIGSGE